MVEEMIKLFRVNETFSTTEIDFYYFESNGGAQMRCFWELHRLRLFVISVASLV